MNPKEQATQQSLQNLEQISNAVSNKPATWFQNYWEKGVDLPTFTEKEDFGKPLAQFSNFLIRDVVGSTISAPANLYQGGLDISKGNYYSGAGKILQGGLDIVSLLPPVRLVGTGVKAARAVKAGGAVAPTLLKAATKEAGIQGAYGAGYGLSQGLIQAQGMLPDQRFGTIATQTGIGAGIGAGLGFLSPVVGAGIGKGLSFLRKEEVLAKNALDDKIIKINKQFKEEVAPKVGEVKETPTIKTPKPQLMDNVVKDVPKQQKRNLASQVVRNVGEENLPKLDGVAREVKDDVLLNMKSGNIDGAKKILSQAPTDVKERVSKWFITLSEKGNITPEQRKLMSDVVLAGQSPTYMPNPSLQKTDAAKYIATQMSRSEIGDVLNKLNNVLQTVQDDVVSGSIRQEDVAGTLAARIVQDPNFQIKNINEVVDLFQPYIDIAYNEPGMAALARKAEEALSLFGTGQGQSIQVFANYVTTDKVVNDALKIVQDTFKKVDPVETQAIQDTAKGLVRETVQATDEILASPQVAEELSDLGEKLIDSVSPLISGVKEPKVKVKRKERKPQEVVRDFVNREVSKIGEDPNATRSQKELAREIVAQNKRIYKEEINKIKTATTGVNQNDRPYAVMSATLKMKPDLQKLVGKVRPLINELFVDDAQRRTYIDALMRRRIGKPYTEYQFEGLYKAFKRDNKVSLKDLSILTKEQYDAYKAQKIAQLSNKLDIMPDEAGTLFRDMMYRLDKEVNEVKANIKQPYEIIAQKAIDSIKSPVTNNKIQTSEQKMYASLVKQLSIVLSDARKETLGTANKPGIDYDNFVFMLKNQSRYSNEWKKAKEKVLEELGNDSLSKQQLQNFFARNVPDVFTERQAQKIAYDQMKKNKYTFNEIVRLSGITRASKKEDIVASLMVDLKGLTAEEAEPLATAVMKFVNDKTEATRQEILQRYLDRLNLTPVQKRTAEQKLFELVNLGAFDDDVVANQLFSVKDLPSISPDDINYINSTLRLAQLPQGAERGIDTRTAYRLIGERLAESNKFKLNNWRDITTAFDAYYYNNIFSSIQTQERNILGGLLNAFVVKPSLIFGEAIANLFFRNQDAGTFSDVPTYYREAFGSILSGKAWNNFKNVWSPDFYPRMEEENIDTFYREARKKGLPPLFTQVGKFMEASDQFVATIIESGTSSVLQRRGVNSQDAAQQAFLESQKFLGKANFGREGWREVGVVDAFFDRIGNFGTALKGRNDAWNFVMTPLVPVLRLAVNFQKLKSKLFLPTQLINMMTKKSRNMEDYAYLSISTALFGLAIDKYMKNEVAFEPPKDDAGRKLFFDSGRKPYSVKIGDNWVPLQYLELYGAPFLFMGAVHSAYREDPNALTNSEVDKLGILMQKFVKSYLVSPTYLNNIGNAIEAINGVNGKDWGNAVAYPVTGLIPFVGLYRDVLDVLDPVRRKKSTAWDEFNALYLPLRQQMETYKTSELTDVPLSTTELYAPYGIGVANQKYDDEYIRTIQTKQFGRQYIKTLEEDKKSIQNAQDQLFVAINTQDYAKAREIIVNNKLTPEQVSSVTNKFKEKDITKNFSPQELALYNMSGTDLEMLKNRSPELTSQINRISEIKKTFESGQKALYDELRNINVPFKPKKPRKLRARKVKAKKVRAKKFKVAKPKPVKVKKLKAIKPVKV